MIVTTGETNGFHVTFSTAGMKALELHAFLTQRVTEGSDIDQRIRDVLNAAAREIVRHLEFEQEDQRRRREQSGVFITPLPSLE